MKIVVDVQPIRAALRGFTPERLRTVVEAAGAEVRKGIIAHFREREQEPENTAGFPKFGQSFGKRGFWSGTRGTSVAEAVGDPTWNAGDQSVLINIDSPKLAHKADPNPPRITPKGGRHYLAIPANARAAAWAGMPRDFNVAGGMTFAFSQLPDGRWAPALVAKQNHLRTIGRGQRAGQQVRAQAGKGTSGIGAPQFWLLRWVQTPHDPRAMPDAAVLTERAATRAASTIERLQRAANQGAT